MNNQGVADILLDISRLLELEGDDAYRIRAYRKAAQSIESLDGDVNEYYREGRLRDIPGVGESIAGTIAGGARYRPEPDVRVAKKRRAPGALRSR